MLRNDGRRIIESKVRGAADGETLWQYLCRRFPYHSGEDWLASLGRGELELGGVTGAADSVVADGALLRYFPAALPEPPVDPDFRIVCDESDVMVVSKPGNLPCHPAGPYFRNTLWYLLSERFGDVFPVNRLDRETSGLILWARNSAAASYLSRNIGGKKYLAIVHGVMASECEASGFICRDDYSKVRKKRRFYFEKPDAKAETASTFLRPVACNGHFTLVEATLATGRTHQIRATLHSLGYPVLGDKLYGVDEEFYLRHRRGELSQDDLRRLVLARQALHSTELTVTFPDGKERKFTSPLPPELAAVMN